MFIPSHPSLVEAVKREACFTLDYSRDRMLHAVEQLSEVDLWWRPYDQANAVGNIVLHVCGNLRQWIVSGVGGAGDTRDRPGEFAHRHSIAKVELVDRLRCTVDEAKAAIDGQDEAALLRTRFVQLADVTGVGAVFHSVAHLEGHAQEVIYIARLRLGERYRFKNVY